jgi:Ca-activated chloride channel family protein
MRFRLPLLCLTGALVASVVCAQSPGRALETIGGPADVHSGTFAMRIADRIVAAPQLSAEYDVAVTGMIARIQVRQAFLNTTGAWVEGVYIFPLSEDAAVDQMRLRVGRYTIEGEIRERSRAKAEYETARESGRRASLVEQERPNVFTTSVANIAPGEQLVVEIEYQQTLLFDAGEFALRIPLVIGPRYLPAGVAGGHENDTNLAAVAGRIAPPIRPAGEPPGNPVEIRVTVDAGLPIADLRSLYHPVQQRMSGDRYEVILAHGSAPADRDFVLKWRPATGRSPRAALFQERVDGEDYSMLLLMPPEHYSGAVLPRDIVFVIDTSGSMSGTSIVQAREALGFALSRLEPADRFNIVRFSTSTHILFSAPAVASSQNLNTALNYVEKLESGGGTEMLPAINAALSQLREDSADRVQQIVFVTDGNIGNEQAVFDAIRQDLGLARLFTVGIGSAPNSYFMSQAARFGRGSFTYIGDVHEVSAVMSSLFATIERPVLSDLRFEWPQGVRQSIHPERIADLFAGQPMIVEMRGALPDELTLSGRVYGSSWSQTIPVPRRADAAGVATAWARDHIGRLLETRHRAEPGDPIYDEVLATALAHHQVSPYTSLVAIDPRPARAPGEPQGRGTVGVNLPAGWERSGLFSRLPAGGSSAPLRLVIGLLLLLLAGAIVQRLRVDGP